jgi:hypothetical protein
MVYAQSAIGMTRKIAHGSETVNLAIQKASPQLARVTEDHLCINPPPLQDGRCGHSIQIAVCDYSSNIQGQRIDCHQTTHHVLPNGGFATKPLGTFSSDTLSVLPWESRLAARWKLLAASYW